jgi:hypothetical protein
MKKILLLVLVSFAFACKSDKLFDEKPDIKNDQDFVDWLSGKEFTTVEKVTLYKPDGTKEIASNPFKIKFDGDRCQVNDCELDEYNLGKIGDEYQVKIEGECYKNEKIELRFNFKQGRKMLASTMFNWQRSKLPKACSYDKLKILIQNRIELGSALRITDDAIKLSGAKKMYMDGFANIEDVVIADTISNAKRKVYESVKFDLDTTNRMASAVLSPSMDVPDKIIYYENKKRDITAFKIEFLGGNVMYSTTYFFNEFGKVMAKHYISEGIKDQCTDLLQYYADGYAFATFCNGKFKPNYSDAQLDQKYVDDVLDKYKLLGGD